MKRTAIKIKNRSLKINNFYLDLLAFKQTKQKYSANNKSTINEKINSLVKHIDSKDLSAQKIHEMIVLYVIPKELQNLIQKEV